MTDETERTHRQVAMLTAVEMGETRLAAELACEWDRQDVILLAATTVMALRTLGANELEPRTALEIIQSAALSEELDRG